MIKKDNLNSLRDNIAISVLQVLLFKCEYLDFVQITELSYEIADKMLVVRNKDLNNVNEGIKQ
jgi:hypothetical protein